MSNYNTKIKIKKEKDDTMEYDGIVTDVLRNNIKVQLYFNKQPIEGQIITSYLSGKLRVHSIKIMPGDKVIVEMSVYDMTKGRIVWRGWIEDRDKNKEA